MIPVKLQDKRHQKWYNARTHVPDDARDVLAEVYKLMMVDSEGKPVFRNMLEVVCFEGGGWYDGQNPRAQVNWWTELPLGLHEVKNGELIKLKRNGN